RIADEDNKEMSEEIIGYIQIKGDNVAAGYYNNASATQQTITEDGWLKTGDLGFLRNGCLYITGRAKDILFSNGENYYAHDIERIAQEIEGIELNKVVVAGGHNNEWGKEEIVLFILHRGKIEDFSQMATSAKLLINQKAGLLIDRVIPVKEIPRTTSGKLQRFRLLEAYKNGDFDDVLPQLDQLTIPIRPQPHSIPEPEYEQRLLEIWKIILKTMEIGIDQHFFSIGGNSLRAAEMTMLVLKEFQVDLPVETIYNIPTIRQLAASISALKKQEYIPIPVADKADRYPLSATQKRLYYFQQTNPSSTAYNIPVAIKITGEIDPALLESCIQQLIIRYDSLRTIFPASVEPAFHVLEPALVSDKFLFTLARTEYRDVDLKDLLKQLVRPFNVATAPLFRANLIEKGHNEYILFLDFHHLIADGISVAHFIRELFLLYRGIALSPLPVQYKDYAASEKEHLQSERIKKQEAFWMQQLQGELPVLELPADFQRPLIFDAGGRKLTFEPDKALLEKLRQLATRHECSLHVLLFTLYNILLYKYTGQQDLIIGIPVAGRRHPDVRQVLGMFVNNLAIRSTTTGDQTFAQLLSDKKNTIAEAFAHQDYPFDHVIQAVQQKRDVGRNPVFDTMFVYQNMGFPAVETPGSLTVSSYPFDPGFSKFDLSLEIFEEAHTLTFAFEYASALFKEETIAAMARHFEVLMQQATEHPNSPVSQLSLISDKEYEEYIHAFNATDAPYPADKTIHQLFDEQVKRTSDNI
ncbi:MAG: condensation domain-containing protein, partial [Niastella sp.]|uniref:condensation domain-containing protein n=1 Tax=Niastella sp. TaxID=1869183 RepID=UPI00389A32F7